LLLVLLALLSLSTNIGVAKADNPLVQVIYTADPAPMVYNNRVYLFTDHDENNSTADMQNWQDHGSPMSLATFSWANANAWAGQVIPANGKFYYYVPIRHSTTGSMAIGVGVSNNIEGPYTDALGKPLVENNEV
jgi:arabinoxylan arabinofuranohydrolase